MQLNIARLDRDRLVSAVRRKIDEGLSSALTEDPAARGFSDNRDLLKRLRDSASQVGSLPPQPPTFRARLGSVLVRAVQRMLFWYTPAIQGFQSVAADALTSHNEQIQRLAIENSRLSDELRQGQRRIHEEIANLKAEIADSRTQIEDSRTQIADSRALIADLTQTQAGIREALEPARELIRGFDSRLQAQQRRLTLLSGKLEELAPALPVSEEKQREFDDFYVAFEAYFRGSGESVAERLKVYVPYLETAEAGTPERPVLDLGCGRGEWLRILHDFHMSGQGVDSNSSMIELCREQNLDVTQSDLMLFLRGCRSDVFGAVTAFHVVEHLPLEDVIEMLRQIRRVMKRGAIAIFETPNPANVVVGSKNFYHDPTHKNPIPSVTLEFLFRHAGFENVQTLPLNPCAPANRVPDDGSALSEKFNEYFFGPQDYAVIGRKV